MRVMVMVKATEDSEAGRMPPAPGLETTKPGHAVAVR